LSEPAETPDFFISFNRADRQAATWIAWTLEKIGAHEVYFQDWDFLGNFVDHMNEGVKKCPRCVAVLSDNYFGSGFTLAEWSAYFARDPANRASTIIPVRVGPLAEENLLSPLIYADLTDCDEATAEQRLLDHVKKAIDPSFRPVPEERPAFWRQSPKPTFPQLTKALATHNLPPRNPDFVGREAELGRIVEALSGPADQPLVLTQAITGLGGVGKTQTALAFAHRKLATCRLVWWLDAEEPAKLAADYAGMAGPLGIPEAADQAKLNAAIRAALQGQDGWLLVFDNAGDPAVLRPFLPTSGGGGVLITSRRSFWQGIARMLPLDVMNEPDALRLLTGLDDPETSLGAEDLAAAKALADDLGHLPLALAQARAFMRERGHGFAAYRQRFAERLIDVMARGADGLDPTIDASADAEGRKRQRAAAVTWDISIEAAEVKAPGARALLELLACFAPDPLPRAILDADPEALPETLRDSFARDDALAALSGFSLVDAKDDNLTTHRLVQAIARARLERADAQAASAKADCAVKLLLASLSEHDPDDHRSWGHYEHVLGHHLAASAHAEALEVDLPAVAHLLTDTATYLYARASYAEAEPLYQRAIAIGEKALGAHHPRLATSLNNLAGLYLATGRHAEAAPLFRRAIASGEKALGPDHPHLAIWRHNLASLYRATGRYAEAEPLLKRTIDLSERTLGPNLISLAMLYQVTGRFAEAEPLYQRGIDMVERTSGADHPQLAASLISLAALYQATGRHVEAEPLCQRGIHIIDRTLGPDHPLLATSLNNLAELYRATGRYAEAEPCYQRAIAIGETALSPDHPDLVTWLNNLALLYAATGRPFDAEPLYRRAIAAAEKALGANHPDLATNLNNLAGLYENAGRYEEAEPLFERAIAIGEKTLGPEHPDLATWLNNLANLYRVTGRLPGAEPLHLRAIRIIEASLPADHPHQAVFRDNYAGLLDALDRPDEAAELRARAQAVRDARAAAGR
jgi:tetratricopeptide (TPR) repeat protein